MTTAAIRLTSPGDLVASIPFILGFHPTDSLVIISIRGGRVGLTTRIDLPPASEAPVIVDALVAPLSRDEAESLIVIAYGEDLEATEERLTAAAANLGAVGFHLRHVITVCGGLWRSLDGAGTGAWASERISVEAAGAAVTAEFVGRGLAPLAGRHELITMVEAGPQAHRAGRFFDQLPDGVLDLGNAEVRCVVAGLWAHLLDTAQDAAPVTGPEAALAALSLREVPLRDGIIAWLTPGTLEVADLPEHVRAVLALLPQPQRSTPDHAAADAGWEAGMRTRNRLAALCTLLPDAHAATMLTVLASHAWWRSEGSLARVALDRALRSDPTNRLARLMDLMVSQGIPSVTRPWGGDDRPLQRCWRFGGAGSFGMPESRVISGLGALC